MATNNKSIFAINMVRARKDRCWSQRQAAQKIGINIKTLQSYEEDRAKPRYHVLELISKVYHIKDWRAFIHDASFLIEA